VSTAENERERAGRKSKAFSDTTEKKLANLGEPALFDAERIEEDKGIILDHFLNLISEDGNVDEVCRFLIHCGINGDDIKRAGGSWGLAVLRHYLTLDGYDIDRAAKDLATFPPVAAAIAELEAKNESRKERRAAEERNNRKRRAGCQLISASERDHALS